MAARDDDDPGYCSDDGGRVRRCADTGGSGPGRDRARGSRTRGKLPTVEWVLGSPNDSGITHGRGWPLLNGERGEYDLAAGKDNLAAGQLTTMSKTANSGGLLPEQVWDHHAPGGRPGFTPGTPTFSATPLAWTHAQFIRLARDIAAGRVSEQPAVVARRYG